MVAYGSLLALVIPRHEPWFDEAQAWLIARDTDPLGLFRILPYEGQPGLWQLLLMLPARLLPYRALNWISGLLGTLGAYVFVRRSPFPLAVKVLVPFTYFFFYQYGVVARNYALLPVVLFSLAAIYPKRHEHPAQFALLLFVLANTSTHGFLIAGTLLGILTAEALRDARKHLRRPRRSEALSILLLGLAMGAIALSMIPPPDRSFATNRAGMVNPRSVFTSAGGMLNRSMADNRMVLLAVMAASTWFLRSRRVLHLYALPTLAVLAFFAFVHNAPWQEGVLLLIWIFALWVGLQQEAPASQHDRWSRRAALAAVVVVSLFQINWNIRTAVLDFNYPYSGSRQLASYIKRSGIENKRIFAFHWASFAVNPYFDRNIFANYKLPGDPSYWLWSRRNKTVQNPSTMEELKPDYIVLAVKIPGSEEDASRVLKSYRMEAVFQGRMFWKGGALQPEVYVLFQRRSAP